MKPKNMSKPMKNMWKDRKKVLYAKCFRLIT